MINITFTTQPPPQGIKTNQPHKSPSTVKEKKKKMETNFFYLAQKLKFLIATFSIPLGKQPITNLANPCN